MIWRGVEDNIPIWKYVIAFFIFYALLLPFKTKEKIILYLERWNL